MSSTDFNSAPPGGNIPSTEITLEHELKKSSSIDDSKQAAVSKPSGLSSLRTEFITDENVALSLEELKIQEEPCEEHEKVTLLRDKCRSLLNDPNDNMARALLGHTWASVNWYHRFLEVYSSTKKATKAIKANQEWRENIRISKYEDFKAEIAVKNADVYSALTRLVGYRHGSSKLGRPVKVMRILSILSPKEIKSIYDDGQVFLKELELLQAKESEWHHFVTVPELLRQKKTPDHYHISIIDLKGCSTKLLKSGLGRKTVKAMLSFDDKHYPDGACKVFLINAPKAFSNVWNMIKRILSKSVTSKIVVLKSNLEPLFELVDKSELPECIGGTSQFKLGEHPNCYKL